MRSGRPAYLFWPVLLLAGGLAARESIVPEILRQPASARLAVFVLLLMPTALAMAYNRARVSAGLVGALATFVFIQRALQVPLSTPAAWLAYNAIACSVLWTGCCLLFMPERGLWTRRAVVSLVTSLLPSVVLLVHFYVRDLDPLLGGLLRLTGPKLLSAIQLPQTIIIAWAVLSVFGLWLLSRRRQRDEALVFTLTLYQLTCLALLDREGISVLVFALLGSVCLIGLVRQSYELAFKDELTGLSGRRAFDRYLRTLGRRYAIAMLDVDHFKGFNDTHGHDVGDDVLRMVARHIGEVGGGGRAFRYGGEEFSVVFARRDAARAEAALETLRERIAGYAMTVRNEAHRAETSGQVRERRGRRKSRRSEQEVTVTISIGLAERSAAHPSPDAVVKAADQALYEAKKAGRNCLRTAPAGTRR